MRPKNKDFSKIIQDLIDIGWTQQRIAKEIWASQSNISNLLNNERSDPRASLALPLLKLHRAEVRKSKRRAKSMVAGK